MVLWLQRYENNSIFVLFSLVIDILSTINVQMYTAFGIIWCASVISDWIAI